MALLINNTHVFIHCAKTGGTFFTEAVKHFNIKHEIIANKHSPYTDIKIEDYKEAHTVFGFIRHPISWYRSRWAYGMMTNFGEKVKYNIKDAKNHWMAPVWDEDINWFVSNTLERYPHGIAYDYFDKMLGISNPDKKGTVVMRYENLVLITAGLLRNISGKDIKIEDVKRIPVALSSAKIKGDISTELMDEICNVESRLIKEYYE